MGPKRAPSKLQFWFWFHYVQNYVAAESIIRPLMMAINSTEESIFSKRKFNFSIYFLRSVTLIAFAREVTIPRLRSPFEVEGGQIFFLALGQITGMKVLSLGHTRTPAGLLLLISNNLHSRGRFMSVFRGTWKSIFLHLHKIIKEKT